MASEGCEVKVDDTGIGRIVCEFEIGGLPARWKRAEKRNKM